MAPPAWLRLYTATGDQRYLDFAVTNWWRTTDYLYDKDAHLFYRDSSFFTKKEANGEKVFWSRGNGWVFAALPRMLQYLPANHPDRPRFEQLFKDMAAKILACQQADGLWRSSLLDPDSFPLKEVSGSGFFTYGFAWGINQGLLDQATYGPAVAKAWTALVGCINADGKLTHIQPVGSDPRKFADDSTAPYGVGAFLLAGSEIYRSAVLAAAKPVAVKVTNPAALRRETETVEVSVGDLVASGIDRRVFASGQLSVLDGLSSRVIDSQTYASEPNQFPDKFIFQVDLAPNETRTYYVIPSAALAAVPPPIVKTMARYVPERYDDFAWESDRIAHRTDVAVAFAACRTAAEIGARFIVVFTEGGSSLRTVSRLAGDTTVIGATTEVVIARRMGIMRGVEALLVTRVETTDEMVENVERTLRLRHNLEAGDRVVITMGLPLWRTGTTNMMKVIAY